MADGILKVGTITTSSGSGTITLGQSGETVNVAGTLQSGGSPIIQGITEADQWRITTDLVSSSAVDITANWERNDTDFALIGTGMTESSGVFTFPSTGIYLVTINATGASNDSSDYVQISIRTTIDNSTYNYRARNYQHTAGAGDYMGWYANIIFDVTNTSNCKVKFGLSQISGGTITLQGNTVENRTYATFIRLGNT